MGAKPEDSLMFKMVIIGDPAVGKTSLRRKYLGQSFIHSHMATIGVDFAQKYVSVLGKTVRLVIWDLAGQHGYESVRRHYYQGCSSIVLAYAINNRESFDNASRWLVEAYRYLEDDFPPVAVIANKADLRESSAAEDLISTEEGEAFTKMFIDKLGVKAFYRETSALNGENVMEVFTTLTAMMIREYERST